jgi:hypothetical protein
MTNSENICPLTAKECNRFAPAVEEWMEVTGNDRGFSVELASQDCSEGIRISGGTLAINECGISVTEEANITPTNASVLEQMTGEQ